MLYRDLVNFEPIDTVIQLRDANAVEDARRLVATYVISDRMASQLAEVVLPQLQIDVPMDNKGVLIVGNYGTGKSHLMSLLSAVAEYPGMSESLTNEKVREVAPQIAGRFKVIRIEIGSVQSSFRDIIVREIEEHFNDWGVDYSFPPANELTNNKGSIIEAVDRFRQVFPDQGLLLVVDEMLDYLRARNEQALLLDLGFLREIGEVAELTPFRFIGGLQETLFDSPRFNFVAEQLRRVRDRFEQVLIAREDIAYVVANRILSKSDEQIATITEHLREFAPLYGHMAERIPEYARLFPIHPSYLDTFQNVAVAEKREVLRTFSKAVSGLLDQTVPADQPGLVSFDHYWSMLQENPSMRTYPEVSEVLDKGGVLDQRVQNNFTRKHLTQMATRIVRALGVHRLTTGDITTPIGLTPEELKDGLCLYVATPEHTSAFLLDQVRFALKEITRSVSGQYITYNDANDQYYLDVKKDIDFDARIDERGAMLGHDELNRYYFDSLRDSLGMDSTTYVSGHRIWFHELPWTDRNVTRPGYFFFGAPDERSTAQPPRDFFLFLLPPFLDREWDDQQRSDEVIFGLEGLDDEFHRILQKYAGSRALENESPSNRNVYSSKATDHRKALISWVTNHLMEHLHVRYQGQDQLATAVLPRARSSASSSILDLIQIVAGTLLTPHFEDQYPEYPVFSKLSQPVNENTRGSNAEEAVRSIAGRNITNLARGILDGLGLLRDGSNISPNESKYATALLAKLHAKPDQQVVNRGEVLTVVAGGVDRPVEKDLEFGLEPEWIAVLLVALVHNGDITLTVGAKQTLDAGNIESAQLISIDDLAHFQHFGRPKQVPLKTWITVFEGLGLQSALIKDEMKRDHAVQSLLATVASELERIVRLEAAINSGMKVWNEDIFNDNFRIVSEGGAVIGNVDGNDILTTTNFKAAVREYKELLQTLQKYNTAGKLRNLLLTDSGVRQALGSRKVVERAEQLQARVQQIQPLTSYLASARTAMPDDSTWSLAADAAHTSLLKELRAFGRGIPEASSASTLVQDLESLKSQYIDEYARLHRKLVLGAADDKKREALYNDPRRKALDELYKVDLVNNSDLDNWKKAISNIPTCKEFHEKLIDTNPLCTCKFRPVSRPSQTTAQNLLQNFDDRLSTMFLNARKALRDALVSESAQSSLANMPDERAAVDTFLAQEDDDTSIPKGLSVSATTAVQGLEAVSITVEELVTALESGGLPCTVDELRRRFEEHLEQTMQGRDARGTRLAIERTVDEILAAAK